MPLKLETILQFIKKYWPMLVVLGYFGLFFLNYSVFIFEDLGRHIVNGKLLLTGSQETRTQILTTNFHSYAQGDFRFINHHWLFGVIVYLLMQTIGFSGLTVFGMSVAVTSLALMLIRTLKNPIVKKSRVGVLVTASITLLFLPLITQRNDIRPELLSLLLFNAFFLIFESVDTQLEKTLIKQEEWKKIWILIFSAGILQLLWVNLHLFFILGPLLAGYFAFRAALQQLFLKKQFVTVQEVLNEKRFLFWFCVAIGLFGIGVLNPNGISGLLAPLNIFSNYAYRVAENQSSFFMINYGANVGYYILVVLLSALALLTFIFKFFAAKTHSSRIYNSRNFGKMLAEFVLLIAFVFVGNKINRMSSFLAVVAIPIVVSNCTYLFSAYSKKIKDWIQNTVFLMIASSASFVLFILLVLTHSYFPNLSRIGTGVLPGVMQPAEFFTQNNLPGPIFNNYDIGGYLIFHLSPEQKIFIDNRPEAYSSQLLQDEYSRSLADDTTWRELEQKYTFQTIFFYRLDQADNAQDFLYRRITDESWVPIFVDATSLILIKNNPENAEIISKFALPLELFTLQKE